MDNYSDWGMMHGRFQPFHIGHIEYLNELLMHKKKVIVAITNSDPTTIVPDSLSPHRHLPDSNPFTFFQRFEMISTVFDKMGKPSSEVKILPFPIHHPDRWEYYVPKAIMQYVSVLGDWEESKASRFREYGYQVCELRMARVTSGTDIRKLMKAGEDWRGLVPPYLVDLLSGHMTDAGNVFKNRKSSE